MSKRYLFIGTDRTLNAGDADAFKALCQFMKEMGVQADMMFCRMAKNPEAPHGNEADKAPLDNASYDRMPLFNMDLIENLKWKDGSDISLIGIGQNTLETLIEALHIFPQAHAFYVTHLVDERCIEQIKSNNITVMTPSYEGDFLKDVPVVPLAGVPHSNTQKSCETHFEAFLETENGKDVLKIIQEKSPFAIAIVNAGSEFNGVQVPYTQEEAADHGAALANFLPPHTALFLAHGGPRNVGDVAAGHDAMTAFRDAYQKAQASRGDRPRVFEERFVRNLPYNAIKAFYILAQRGNCLCFVSSCDGRGTAEGALALVPSHVPKAMFQSRVSLKHEASLLDELHTRGLGIFVMGANGLDIRISPQTMIRSQEDPSLVVLKTIGI